MMALLPTRRFTAGIVGTAAGAALFALAGVGVLGTRAAEEQLAEARLAKAAAVGRAVQRDLHRALGHGIPLDRVEGMTAYLQGIAERNPDLHVLAVTAADGRTLHTAGSGRTVGEGPGAVRLPLRAGSTVAGHLLVAVDSGRVRAQIVGDLAGIALGAAAVLLLVAELAAALVQTAVRAPLGRLERALAAGAAGEFGTLLGRRPRDQIGRALLAFNAAVFHLHERRQRFAAHAEEVRGAVFDAGIAAEVDRTRSHTLARLGDGTATAPVRADDPRPGDARAGMALLSAAAVLGCVGGTGAIVALSAAAGAFGLVLAARRARAAGENAADIARSILAGTAAALLWSAARGWSGGMVEAALLGVVALPALLPVLRRT